MRDQDVAVIGMAGRFPGAPDLRAFWRNLRGGIESISFFSGQELRKAGIDPATIAHPDYVPAAGVIEEPTRFDASFFGISPAEAARTDPQHRLFLECAWHALEDAGHAPNRFEVPVGVFAGAGRSGERATTPADLAGLIGDTPDFLTSRVSYKLDLRGPSFVVQTSCSTSLVAIHLACRSLLAYECDVALAGGVSVRVPQARGHLFHEGGIYSRDGHCRAFDAAASGTVGGSGVGIVVLRRLADALEAGDRIRAVIRGSAINNDGAAKVGYAAPGVEGQAEAIALAQELAEVDPTSITLVEAHGTGTRLGDPVEVAALRRAFGPAGGRRQFCALGSVKTNVGHLDAAAGVAGLIKTVLALEHRERPPSLHFERPNPEIDFADSPFFVNERLRPWERDETPLRAGVSSFGVGGTNAHVVLEEAPERPPAGRSRPTRLFVLSAASEAALDHATASLRDELADDAAPSLDDVEFTLQTGRSPLRHRRAWVGRTREEAVERLGGAAHAAVVGATARPSVAFLFPGQGAQHPRMGRELYESERVFRDGLDRCAEVLREPLGLDLRDLLLRAENDETAARRLQETRLAQPALFSVSFSLAGLWIDWGLRPAALLGHSVGEYVAACLAGVFAVEDALRLVAARGRLVQAEPSGAMLALSLAPGEAEALLRTSGETGLSIAAINAPSRCVVSGETDAIERLERNPRLRDVGHVRLRTSHAFHSPMMDRPAALLAREVASVPRGTPAIPWVSNVTGTWIDPQDAVDPGYWGRHLRAPVRFADGLATLFGDDGRVLLEVGPGRTLVTLARAVRPERRAVASMPHPGEGRSESEALLEAAGELWTSGLEPDWRAFHDRERRLRVALPLYPFEGARYEPPAARGTTTASPRDPAGWLYVPAWRRAARAPRRPAQGPAGAWLVFGDREGLADAVVARLERDGHDVVRVVAGESYAETGAATFAIRPGNDDDHERLLEALRKGNRRPDRILHLWGVGHSGPTALDRGVFGVAALVRVLSGESASLTVVTSGAHDVTGEESLDPASAAVLGVCRAIADEEPGIACGHVDVIAPGRGDEWEALAAEILEVAFAEAPEPTLALRNGARWIPVCVPAPEGESPLRDQGVYVVTGGLGGVGLEIAHALAERLRARLVLVARTPAGPQRPGDEDARRARKLEEVERAASAVLVRQADVTRREELEAVIAEAETRFGAVHGLIHAAGPPPTPTFLASRDRNLREQALEPRLAALQALDQALADRPVDFVAVASSLSTIVGAAGFSAYAAAHHAVDAFVARRARRDARWRAVRLDNWETWRHRLPPSSEAGPRMTAEEGADAFLRALACYGNPVVSIGSPHERRRSTVDAPATGHGDRRTRPRGEPSARAPRDAHERSMAEIWSEVLGIEEVGIDENFFDLGGDSVLGAQIVARARQRGLELRPADVFDHQTIAELVVAARKTAPGKRRRVIPGPVPLTPLQRWFFAKPRGEREPFHLSLLVETPPDVDAALLFEAVRSVAARHDALRLRFPGTNPGEALLDDGPPELRIARFDHSHLPDAAQHPALEREAASLHADLDPEHGPLSAVAWFDRGPAPGRLLWIAHHLLVDERSWRILRDDLEETYRRLERGQTPTGEPASDPFQGWAAAVDALGRSEGASQERARWLEIARLAAPDPETARPNGTGESDPAFAIELDPGDTEALLQGSARAYGVRVEEVALAALLEGLSRSTGRRRHGLMLEGDGREAVPDAGDFSYTVGWFTTLHPAFFDLTGARGPAEVLKAVKESVRSTPRHGLGYGLLRQAGLLPESDAHEPTIGFSFLGNRKDREGSGRFRRLDEPCGPAAAPGNLRGLALEVIAGITAGRLRIELLRRTATDAPAEVEQLAGRCREALVELLEHCRAPGTGGYTPSDFPAARIGQRSLDRLVARLGQGSSGEDVEP